jgi:hypothetical protein
LTRSTANTRISGALKPISANKRSLQSSEKPTAVPFKKHGAVNGKENVVAPPRVAKRKVAYEADKKPAVASTPRQIKRLVQAGHSGELLEKAAAVAKDHKVIVS